MDFSILCEQVEKVIGLKDSLSDRNNSWTIFAPTNDAFGGLSKTSDGEYELFSNEDFRKEIIQYHFIYGYREDLSCFNTIINMRTMWFQDLLIQPLSKLTTE